MLEQEPVLYRKSSPHKPSSYLITKLRRYEELHKRCGPYTKSYNRSIKQLVSGQIDDSTDCRIHRGYSSRIFYSRVKSTVLSRIIIIVIGYFEKLKNIYGEHPTKTGEMVAIYQPSHEEDAWSTFGYVAQGLGGMRPWILYKINQTKPDPLCGRGMSMEPCYHAPPVYGCKAKTTVDTTTLVPHERVPFSISVNSPPPLANTAKFIFDAQSAPKPSTNGAKISTDASMDPIDFPLSCKRAREDGLCSTDSVRRGQLQSARRDHVLEGGSFKTKLMGSSNPGEWSGFGSGNPPVSINEDDIVYGKEDVCLENAVKPVNMEKRINPYGSWMLVTYGKNERNGHNGYSGLRGFTGYPADKVRNSRKFQSGKDGVGSSAAPSGPSGNGGSVNKDQGAAEGDDLREGNEILFDKKSKGRKPMSSEKGGPSVDGKKVLDDIFNKVENPGKHSKAVQKDPEKISLTQQSEMEEELEDSDGSSTSLPGCDRLYYI
ncbi:hypothetical protein JRO89_XS14G0122300 [Xanthoceras sorbifolium]|uniref:Fucosyltransferase n=1 Tax=Xanthoceras sorbifolium TaxID=99658 RepID=A0ABQ8H533_9ROSI|nr:hypothetical protein JRO89_XS14G0122300 [Xanthoceras sorbifolium]